VRERCKEPRKGIAKRPKSFRGKRYVVGGSSRWDPVCGAAPLVVVVRSRPGAAVSRGLSCGRTSRPRDESASVRLASWWGVRRVMREARPVRGAVPITSCCVYFSYFVADRAEGEGFPSRRNPRKGARRACTSSTGTRPVGAGEFRGRSTLPDRDRPVLEHGPRSATCVQVRRFQTAARSESERGSLLP
jgi:hypothetical protein